MAKMLVNDAHPLYDNLIEQAFPQAFGWVKWIRSEKTQTTKNINLNFVSKVMSEC